MKQHISEFLRRGFVACGTGPLVLVVFYLVLRQCVGIETLTVSAVCTGIVSLSALAFIAGGMNFIYQIERLPLMPAILIHGIVLYISYLMTYLINGWLQWGTAPVLVFTAIFVVGFFAIWGIIYGITKNKTARLNEGLKKKQQHPTE